jgi:hypothetical protein
MSDRSRRRAAGEARLHALVQRIRQGWRLEAPVIGRSVDYWPHGGGRADEVVLRHTDARLALALPDSPAAQLLLPDIPGD